MNSTNQTPKNQDVEKRRAHRAECISYAAKLGKLDASASVAFWKYLDGGETGFTPFPHEAIALRATVALFESAILDRSMLFNTDGLGFVDVMEVIANTVLETLPDIIDNGDGAHWLVALAIGRPAEAAADEPTPAPTSDAPLTDAQRLEMVSQFIDAELRKLEHLDASQGGAE